MYHYNAAIALEELAEEALLPNPVHVRDMLVRSRLTPQRALELSREFQSYMQAFGEARKLARELLAQLAQSEPKS
ncbi:MAG: hypothetical protein HY822_20340 [Acidobacteria bacterium]|nr:hypothetical protein [Acidobacteriota bacterium]